VSAPAGWDDAAARSPGGHVLQSSAWARIREAQRSVEIRAFLWRDDEAGKHVAADVPRQLSQPP